MKLRFDPTFLDWLDHQWNGAFDWDAGNREKNEKHGITVSEIEKIFNLPVYVSGRIEDSEDEPRWLLLGETVKKPWALIVTARGKSLRVISCRRQRKKEVQFYEEIKKNRQI